MTMEVRVLFIHPEKGMQDVSIQNATSVEAVSEKLKELNCAVLLAEEVTE